MDAKVSDFSAVRTAMQRYVDQEIIPGVSVSFARRSLDGTTLEDIVALDSRKEHEFTEIWSRRGRFLESGGVSLLLLDSGAYFVRTSTGIEKVVIGVSGGLDSTHALIVVARAMDRLELPRENVLAYTLPGFATSEHTKGNAHALMEALGVSAREIDIRPSAEQMLRDLESGGQVEADHIVGWMLERARAHGIDDTLLSLAFTHLKTYESRRAAGRLPGS